MRRGAVSQLSSLTVSSTTPLIVSHDGINMKDDFGCFAE